MPFGGAVFFPLFLFFPFDKTNDEQHALLTDRHGSALTCLGGKRKGNETKNLVAYDDGMAWHGMAWMTLEYFYLH